MARTVAARPALDIMAGHQRCGAELLGTRHEIGKLDGLIAADARHRRFAAQIAVGEIIDHRLPETRFEIEHIVGDVERRRHPARIVDVLAGAAGLLLPQGASP